ncbi:MAG: hypothetical protein Q9191_001428 [Dirinaria sp. TL-2023a]
MKRVGARAASFGANRHPAAADWDVLSGLLAYGSDRNIALWDPLVFLNPARVIGIAYCVDRMKRGIAGSADKTIRIWKNQRGLSKVFQEVSSLEGHASSVNCLCAIPQQELVVSGSADGTLKVWRLNLLQEGFGAILVQNIQVGPQLLPLALASSDFGIGGDSILTAAGTNGIVQVYTAGYGARFQLQATLAGHHSWVRGLAITKEKDQPDSDILLASASQDKYIRLWRLYRVESLTDNSLRMKSSLLTSLSNKSHRLQTSHGTYALTLEALLLGHEDWIYTVQWRRKEGCLQLLSASADNSLAIWQVEEDSGIWVCSTRLGEISSQKGSTTATGSSGGFWIGLWSPDGDSVVSLGKTGSWRLWHYDSVSDHWTPISGISGHICSITGIAWARGGGYLLSTGLDQTTRLHAPWRRQGSSFWHEFARPQIHGYDLNCIDSVGRSQFISGADEKALRVFDEPKRIAEVLQKSCGIPQPSDLGMPEVADIPVLGLSNKTVERLEDSSLLGDRGLHQRDDSGATPAISAKTLALEVPPLEDDLARHTLWPEREKLYGHGYEISAVAANSEGTIVATACKASSLEHAVVRLYDTKDWHEIKPVLTAHSLTVTCLRFSRDDRYLMSVGRDRQWAIFEKDDGEEHLYRLRTQNTRGHSRMILSASWAPLEVGSIFATAGRDKAVKLWNLLSFSKGHSSNFTTNLQLTTPVTAIDFYPRLLDGALLLALGMESGEVAIHTFGIPHLALQKTFKFDNEYAISHDPD